MWKKLITLLTSTDFEMKKVEELSTSQYEKILQAHRVNTKKYWLVEVIENDCIVTWSGVYDEILPEPSGNPSGSALGRRQYFIVYPSSRHNTVIVEFMNSSVESRVISKVYKIIIGVSTVISTVIKFTIRVIWVILAESVELSVHAFWIVNLTLLWDFYFFQFILCDKNRLK